MKNCIDIGIIQAFLDGELPTSEVARVSDHIEGCDACAVLLSQAEDENAVVFPALAREFDTMVPTQRLWARIEDSIQFEKDAAPFWQKLYGIIISGFASPQIAVAAGLLLVVGIVAILVLNKPAASPDIAYQRPANVSTVVNVAPVTTGEERIIPPSATSRSTVEVAYRAPRRQTAEPTVRPNSSTTASTADANALPGEESYISTIASLSKSVSGDQDPNVMSASQQVSFARDMAVVDDTIKRMRSAVRQNPKNGTAKQMLSAAYQNKIDLLNSVAQKEELVASLGQR
jgi:anti-sigma factor RsiW